MKYSIVKPQIADVPGLIAMHKASWHETYAGIAPGATHEWIDSIWAENKQDRRKEIIMRSQQDPEHVLYKIVKDESGDIKGFLHIERHSEHASFDAIYLLQEAQGSGIAQQLMDVALAFAGDLPMELQVVDNNPRAIAFYERNGFQKIPGTEKVHREKLPIITMKRPANNTQGKE